MDITTEQIVGAVLGQKQRKREAVDRVFAAGKFVGYIQHKTGARLFGSPAGLSTDYLASVVAALRKIRPDVSRRFGKSPPVLTAEIQRLLEGGNDD
jgi:hypothetical protein